MDKSPGASGSKTAAASHHLIEQISEQEMPALASTVRQMDSLAQDENSSLAELGQSVLHDHALTSRILRVANSASYNLSQMPITTVSRAAVMLGFKAIRNICITSKLLENLLQNQKLSKPVYERLLALMAKSFHAGMLAKMMTKDLSSDEQEEVFIAALLQHLGESAFWSRGGAAADDLHQQLALAAKQETEIVKENLGLDFKSLNLGVAKSWGLGDVLLDSLEGKKVCQLTKAVHLADELSGALANPKQNPQELQILIDEVSDLMGVDGDEARESIRHWTDETFKLASSFGADEIKRYIAASAKAGQEAIDEVSSDEPAPKFYRPDESLQMQVLRDLTFMSMGSNPIPGSQQQKPDFNLIIHTTLEGIYRGLGMDRAMLLLLNKESKQLQPRFVSSPDSDVLKQHFRVASESLNAFAKALRESSACFIEHPEEDFSELALKQFLPRTGFMLAPVMLMGKTVGVFYADRGLSSRPISESEVMTFNHFVQQANLCLMATMKH